MMLDYARDLPDLASKWARELGEEDTGCKVVKQGGLGVF